MKGTQVKNPLIITTIAIIAISGCTSDESFQRQIRQMAPSDDQALAEECLSSIRTGNFEAVKGYLDPKLVKPGLETNLAEAAGILTQGSLISMELVGYKGISRSIQKQEQESSELTYQFQLTDAWAVAVVTINTMGQKRGITGINVVPIPASLQELNAFTFLGKGILHYFFLFLAAFVILMSVWAIVLCARTRVHRKIWWILFILVGIMRLDINWTTGQLGFQIISLGIPVAQIGKAGLYSPWIFSISLPLGAILFFKLLERKQQDKRTHP